MKNVYFGGKFRIAPHAATLEASLARDYRALLLGDAAKMCQYQKNLTISADHRYLGPFYCEEASEGDFTSTDCNVVLAAERRSVEMCDMFVCVFDESFSVGSVVELGWALDMNKEILLLYREEKSKYRIQSEYWFAIADALVRSDRIQVIGYQKEEDVVPLLKERLHL